LLQPDEPQQLEQEQEGMLVVEKVEGVDNNSLVWCMEDDYDRKDNQTHPFIYHLDSRDT